MNLRFAIYDLRLNRNAGLWRGSMQWNAGLRHGSMQWNAGFQHGATRRTRLKHAGPEAGAPS